MRESVIDNLLKFKNFNESTFLELDAFFKKTLNFSQVLDVILQLIFGSDLLKSILNFLNFFNGAF
jgi:hypothetical protein